MANKNQKFKKMNLNLEKREFVDQLLKLSDENFISILFNNSIATNKLAKSTKKPKQKSTSKSIISKVKSKEKTISWHSNTKVNKSKVIVNIQNINKNYGKKEVLKDINLKLYEGERVAIIGPNGAGKSTLSEIIAGIKQKSSGSIEYSFGNTKADISRNIGIQFQESSYPMFVKVKAVVKFFIDAAGIKISNDKLTHLLDLFNLTNIWSQMAEGLSGGQKQRLNILLAVIHEPKLLILDEVGTGLDVETRTNVKSFIKKYLDESNATSIIVSHNTDEVMTLADRIIVIYEGRIYLDKMLNEIIKEYGNFDKFIDELFLKQFEGEKQKKLALQKLSDDSKLEKSKKKKKDKK